MLQPSQEPDSDLQTGHPRASAIRTIAEAIFFLAPLEPTSANSQRLGATLDQPCQIARWRAKPPVVTRDSSRAPLRSDTRTNAR